jgi:hypothetical protein
MITSRIASCGSPQAIESYATSNLEQHDAEPDEILEAEIVERAGESANDRRLVD